MTSPSPAVGYSYLNPPSASSDVRHLTSVAMSPASPASSMSSFSVPSNLSKPLGTAVLVRPKLLQTALPEVNALTRVLSLSDSVLNYFSDKNYDSANLCTCSTSTSAKSDSRRKSGGTPLKSVNFEKCLCGFGVLEGSKFSKGVGLFPEDEVGVVKSELSNHSAPSSTSLVKSETAPLINIPKLPKGVSFSASLLDIILDQCSSPFSCSTLHYQLLHNKGCSTKNTVKGM